MSKEVSIKIEHLDEYHYPIGHELFGKYKVTVYDDFIEGSFLGIYLALKSNRIFLIRLNRRKNLNATTTN